MLKKRGSIFGLLVIALLILGVGYGQARLDAHLQAQIGYDTSKELVSAAAYEQLGERIEQYRLAFIRRDYHTMYSMSIFKGALKPSIIEYINIRTPQADFQINVNVLEVDRKAEQAVAKLELTLYHPKFGSGTSIHDQEWEYRDGIWYRVDYGY